MTLIVRRVPDSPELVGHVNSFERERLAFVRQWRYVPVNASRDH